MTEFWAYNCVLAKNQDLMEIVIPVIIFLIYAVASLINSKLKKKTGPEEPGTEERPNRGPARVPAETAQARYDEAIKAAQRQYAAKMQMIREYARANAPGREDATWKEQLETARQEVLAEFEDAKAQARKEFFYHTGHMPGEKAAVSEKPKRAAPVQAAPEPAVPSQPVAEVKEIKQVKSEQLPVLPADQLLINLKSRDELAKAFIYSEILGKPLALRE
jgi:hypothetical protein